MKKKNTYLPTKFSLIIRIGVALYLFYTIYSLREVLFTSTGKELVFFIAAIVMFGAAAIFLCIHSAKALRTGSYVGGVMDTESEDEENKENKEDKEEKD